MPAYLFCFFAALAIGGALGVVLSRNPVSSAFSLIVSFAGVAALFLGLNAYFIATIQILVYAGAIMVLFLFIIMLLDLKTEERRSFSMAGLVGGAVVGVSLLACLVTVLTRMGAKDVSMPALAAGRIRDVEAIGQVIYSEYPFPLQVVGVLLLVATVGVVVLSKRQLN
jgi:NADH-quinone oxidoreductase subunit J